MRDEPMKVLRELAKRFGKRVSRGIIYDANVCTWRAIPDRPWEFVVLAGEPFSRELRYTYRQRKVRLFANKMYVNGNVEGTFAIRALTVNAKDKIGLSSKYAMTLRADDRKCPVFTENGRLSPEQRSLLARPELTALVKESDLQGSESLHFTGGRLTFYFGRPALSRVTNAIDHLIDLAGRVETTEGELDLKLLPVPFHPFIPLIKKWAVADDSDRDELLAHSQTTALQVLVDEVEPHLRSIDSYLDTFGDRPPTEEAAALGTLAECVLEAKQHLKKRQRQRA